MCLAPAVAWSVSDAGTRSSRSPSAFAGPGLAWVDCGERLQCARVRVPLNWDRPNGRKITLSVIRHLASRPEQRIGSLFVNFGGPGVPGVAAVRGGGAGLD